MLRSVKNIFWMLALAAGAQSALGFALIGPPNTAGTDDAFQQPVIAYGETIGDQGTPKRLHEEYRRNTPVMYWAYDESFLNYFGTNGVNAVGQALQMYNSVGKVSQLDPNDYPEDSRRVNFQATQIGLFDLKSAVAGLMTQELGLFEPSRWVWALSQRTQLPPPPGAPGCPFNMGYVIDQRNYSVNPSALGTGDYPTTTYVNGVLYSYFIDEFCTGPNPLADAVEMPADPLTQPYSAVADFASFWYVGLVPGTFYTSLTRDDVAGLKYLYDTNNLNIEGAGARVTAFITNDVPQIITTQDLGALAAAARVNNAAALQALFPGLQILSTSNFFGLQVTTNITQLLVNSPFDPAGFPPTHSVIFTNYTTNVVQFFVHTFGNIVTNTFGTLGTIGTVTQSISNSPFAPAGTPPVTNTLVKLFPTKGVFGDFFILPTNTCSAVILSNLLTTVTAITNLPTLIVNPPGTGNTNAITFVPGSVTFTTNHTLVYLPVNCPLDSFARRGGVDRVQFVLRPYDSIVSQIWDPVTNNYTITEFDDVNGAYIVRHFSRRVPRPDFLFTTADFSGQSSITIYSNTVDNATETFTLTFTVPPGSIGIGYVFNNAVLNGAPNAAYDQRGRPGNLNGPGTITNSAVSPRLFIFNSEFPVFQNLSVTGPPYIVPTEADQLPFVAWGSFDGTTNAPVVYPNGTTFTALENLILGPQSATPTLPDGTIGVFYSAQLAARAGTAPYTWSLAPTSPGLPGGLNLSADGKITGIPSGPAAIYDFTVRITDSAGKSRDVQYTITIF